MWTSFLSHLQVILRPSCSLIEPTAGPAYIGSSLPAFVFEASCDSWPECLPNHSIRSCHPLCPGVSTPTLLAPTSLDPLHSMISNSSSSCKRCANSFSFTRGSHRNVMISLGNHVQPSDGPHGPQLVSTLGTKCGQRIKASLSGGNVPSAAISISSATNLDRGLAPVGWWYGHCRISGEELQRRRRLRLYFDKGLVNSTKVSHEWMVENVLLYRHHSTTDCDPFIVTCQTAISLTRKLFALRLSLSKPEEDRTPSSPSPYQLFIPLTTRRCQRTCIPKQTVDQIEAETRILDVFVPKSWPRSSHNTGI
jgi:hypothetical protein